MLLGKKKGEIGRTPLSEVSSLTTLGLDNKASRVEAVVKNISRAMLKHIDPKARVIGAGNKEGEGVLDTDPKSLGPPLVCEEYVDGDPKPDEIMQIEAGGDVINLTC